LRTADNPAIEPVRGDRAVSPAIIVQLGKARPARVVCRVMDAETPPADGSTSGEPA
jgi:hypothetical protein